MSIHRKKKMNRTLAIIGIILSATVLVFSGAVTLKGDTQDKPFINPATLSSILGLSCGMGGIHLTNKAPRKYMQHSTILSYSSSFFGAGGIITTILIF